MQGWPRAGPRALLGKVSKESANLGSSHVPRLTLCDLGHFPCLSLSVSICKTMVLDQRISQKWKSTSPIELRFAAVTDPKC